ncbi:MAG: hypothetical protein ACYSWU_05330 [Planctomycetota bacterium]|jgi:hypothetical protein
MTTVKEIESAIARLSREELARFRAWFEEFEAESWDRQIEEDVQAGKLDKLADQAIERFQAGRCTEL